MSVLDKVGWVQNVIVNQRTGFMVDGHLRVVLALRRGEPVVPVSYVDLSDEDEALVLATFDAVTGMAATDPSALQALLDSIMVDDAGLKAQLDKLIEQAVPTSSIDGGSDGTGSEESGGGINVQCPRCGKRFVPST